jgi:hypothetical protein
MLAPPEGQASDLLTVPPSHPYLQMTCEGYLSAYCRTGKLGIGGECRGIGDQQTLPFLPAHAARGIVDRVLQTSFIAALPRDEQDIVRAKIERIIKSDPLLADGEAIEFPCVTELYLFGEQGE